MAKIMTVIGADFSANAMSLPQVVDIFNASYLQPNGYYDINITIGVTKYTDVKTSVGVYKSTLVPIESGYNYTLQSYEMLGSNILAYALVDSDGVILKYEKVLQNIPIEEFNFNIEEDYQTANRILICYTTETQLPVLMRIQN